MRREQQCGSQGHFHLCRMPMAEQPISGKTSVHGAEAGRFLRLAPGAAHARRSIDDQTLRLDQPAIDQRPKCDDCRSCIATGRCDGFRVANGLTIELRNPIDEFPQKIGRIVCMAVPALVGRSIIQPKVCAEIDNRDSPSENLGRQLLAMPVRKCCEDEVDPVERLVLEPLEIDLTIERSEVRVHVRDLLSSFALAEQFRGLKLWVGCDQAQQLAANIARGSEDRRSNHEGVFYRLHCILMQVNAYSCI